MDDFEFAEASARIAQMVVRKELTPMEGAAAIEALKSTDAQQCRYRGDTCVVHGNAALTCRKDRE